MGWFQKDKKDPTEITAGQDSVQEPSAGLTIFPSEHGDGALADRLNALFQDQTPSKGVVMKIHLENFRQLNDILGYSYCEDLLAQIISYLEKESGCPVYRYIGVEFLIFLEKFTVTEASDLAEDILAQFDHVWKVNGTDCLCTAQLGLCPYPGYASSAEELMKLLDMALAKAGDLGPNQYLVYDSQMQAAFLRRQTIAQHLQYAIERHEIEVRYRPTYNIETERFSRAEYYMRIFIPGIGLVGSQEFLPIAEDSGQIRAVEYYALDRAGACVRRLLDEGREFDSIALPVSSVLFLQEDFTEKLTGLIEKYQIPAGKLAVELQEDIFSMGSLTTQTTLQELSSMGVELILNHFGSGLSSIAGILDLSVNTLKLDRMFIWQLETNPKAAAVISGLIRIARELGLNIIAEGVETQNQLDVLNGSGCTFQQGFYYSPTLEEDVLAKILGQDLNSSCQIIEQEKLKMKR